MPKGKPKSEMAEQPKKKRTKRSPPRTKTKKPDPPPPHARLLNSTTQFLSDLGAAKDMFDTVVPALQKQDSETVRQIRNIVKRMKSDSAGTDAKRSRVTRHARQLLHHARKLTRADLMFRSHALVCIVSRYDQFLTDILKNAYRKNPARATAPDRSLTYDDLLTIDDLGDIVELFIERDIDGLLRDSHDKQVDTVDREFKLGIKESFIDYPLFIEMTERRNLFVHCGGIVNKSYIKRCKDVGYTLETDLKPGDMLYVSDEYFTLAIKCLHELGVRLGYALACRVYPDHLEDIHSAFLREAGFPLLLDEDWALAYRVFQFGLEWPEKFVPTDVWPRYYAINEALSLNHLGRHDEAVSLLEKYDWSTQSSKLLLAVAVVRHKWRESESLMSGMNGKKPFTEDNFRSWPIFKEFRDTKEFRRAYKAVYGKRYVVRLSKQDAAEAEKASKSMSEQDKSSVRGKPRR